MALPKSTSSSGGTSHSVSTGQATAAPPKILPVTVALITKAIPIVTGGVCSKTIIRNVPRQLMSKFENKTNVDVGSILNMVASMTQGSQ